MNRRRRRARSVATFFAALTLAGTAAACVGDVDAPEMGSDIITTAPADEAPELPDDAPIVEPTQGHAGYDDPCDKLDEGDVLTLVQGAFVDISRGQGDRDPAAFVPGDGGCVRGYLVASAMDSWGKVGPYLFRYDGSWLSQGEIGPQCRAGVVPQELQEYCRP